jgi:hypothetical protein
MSEEKYRLAIIILFSVFVFAFIILGIRFTENGRYAQYDHQKDHIVFGNSMRDGIPAALDSRTGKPVLLNQQH